MAAGTNNRDNYITTATGFAVGAGGGANSGITTSTTGAWSMMPIGTTSDATDKNLVRTTVLIQKKLIELTKDHIGNIICIDTADIPILYKPRYGIVHSIEPQGPEGFVDLLFNKNESNVVHTIDLKTVSWIKIEGDKDYKIAKEIKINSKIKLIEDSTLYFLPSEEQDFSIKDINTDKKEKTAKEGEFIIENIFDEGIIVKRESDGKLFCTSPKLIIEVLENIKEGRLKQIED